MTNPDALSSNGLMDCMLIMARPQFLLLSGKPVSEPICRSSPLVSHTAEFSIAWSQPWVGGRHWAGEGSLGNCLIEVEPGQDF